MTRYLFYFHYWYEDEPLEVAIDFEPTQKATELIDEVANEIAFHTGEEPTPKSIFILEPFNLRPFHPTAWEMDLDRFVAKYGNIFAVIDLNQPDIGRLEYFQPKQITSKQRAINTKIRPNDPNWPQRAKLELRLITTLIRWLTFYRKTKWFRMIPYEQQKYQSKVWKIETDIPDAEYTAEWRLIIPENYPEEHPIIYLRQRDVNVVNQVDFGKIWQDIDGTTFYYIPDITIQSCDWGSDNYVADFIITGFWNFLARTLRKTFPTILFYKENVGNPKLLENFPSENRTEEHKPWINFFTWFLQRIPEKALEYLKEIQKIFPNHPILNQLNWRLTQNILNAGQLEYFNTSILLYFKDQGKNNQLWQTDLSFLEKLNTHWKFPELQQWLETNRKTKSVNLEKVK
ncbi:MAG: hypothetical protein ACXAC7_06645 [Candidatus Hodarchaeales archaeon]|jgi:hypothetical protein